MPLPQECASAATARLQANEAHDGVSEFLGAVGVGFDVHEAEAQLGCSGGTGGGVGVGGCWAAAARAKPALFGTVPQSGGQTQLNRKLTDFNGNGNQGNAYIFQWQ